MKRQEKGHDKEQRKEKTKNEVLRIEVVRKEKTAEKPKSKTTKIFFAILLLAAFLALTSAKPGMITKEYQAQETTIEENLKTITETYNETTFTYQVVPYVRNNCQGENIRMEPYKYEYSMNIDTLLLDGKRKIICAANVTNKESIPGNFTFYVEIVRSDGIVSNYLDQTMQIPANDSRTYIWRYEVESYKTAVCTLKPTTIPTIARCEVSPIGMTETKKVAVTVEKERNVTVLEKEPRTITVTKTREEEGYINRLLGYEQPFYLGY